MGQVPTPMASGKREEGFEGRLSLELDSDVDNDEDDIYNKFVNV